MTRRISFTAYLAVVGVFTMCISFGLSSSCGAAGEPANRAADAEAGFRAPAFPLAVCDPYFSVWSPADRLYDAETIHWTGKPHPLHGLIRVDGKAYRVVGSVPGDTPPLPQKSVEVLPLRTIYVFGDEQIELTLTFLTPFLPNDLEVFSWPMTYVTWSVRSTDGKDHAVSLYFDASSELTVNTPDQRVVWDRLAVSGLTALRVGSEEQAVLSQPGDDIRIDWGHLLLAAAAGESKGAIRSGEQLRSAFVAGKPLPADEASKARAAGENSPTLALAMDCGNVGKKAVARTAILAYDDEYSINYFGEPLRAYWRRTGADSAKLLANAAEAYPPLAKRAEAFDKELLSDLTRVGGERYARLAALAYRQAFAGGKLAADSKGGPLFFPKECFSNGCIATVDVIYPMSPQFLLFAPAVAKASIANIMEYARSSRWKFPFAPHDLGTYPFATGQVYGGGESTEENQMPVEESGNMLILVAAVARMDGNAEFAERYWPELERWAAYLRDKGLDPENQLCTDDFMGHLAHNANLSIKAILALGAYADLCKQLGKTEEAQTYRRLAEGFAKEWMRMADDGDHYRLAFDKPGTWSQKYNLVWDGVLGLNLFSEAIAKKEMSFYRKTMARYGLTLDNRHPIAKSDWTLWTACLTGDPTDFEALVSPVYDAFGATPDRVPMTDFYDVETAHRRGFQARPVVGGYFMRLLDDPQTWKKYASRGANVENRWAAVPPRPVLETVVETAQTAPAVWRYTTEKPPDGWMRPEFDDSSWATGRSGFGSKGTPGAIIGTEWTTADIWIRREIQLPDAALGNPYLLIHHDEDAEVYINGVLGAKVRGFTSEYREAAVLPEAGASLRPGRNVLAVHCHQTTGGQYIDVGIADAETNGAGVGKDK